jgi:hypothetical protein
MVFWYEHAIVLVGGTGYPVYKEWPRNAVPVMSTTQALELLWSRLLSFALNVYVDNSIIDTLQLRGFLWLCV